MSKKNRVSLRTLGTIPRFDHLNPIQSMNQTSQSESNRDISSPNKYVLLCIILALTFILGTLSVIVFQRQVIYNLSGERTILATEKDELQKKLDGVFSSSAYALIPGDDLRHICMPIPAPGRKIVYHKVFNVITRRIHNEAIYIIASKNLESGVAEITVTNTRISPGEVTETVMQDEKITVSVLSAKEAQAVLEKFGRVGQK